jgi:predicted metal-binding membrane protein
MALIGATPRHSVSFDMASHPEWWTLLLSASAWLLMLGYGQTMHVPMLCLSPLGATGWHFALNIERVWQTGILPALLLAWVMMTMAMMPPLSIPHIRHIAARSFAARRNRAIAGFLAGLIGIWLLSGLIVLPVLAALPWPLASQSSIAAIAFLIAATWQMMPMKRAALSRCHNTVTLAATGWRADGDCVRYGVSHGLDCIVSCWAMMLAMAVASHSMVIALGIQAIALLERWSRIPRYGASTLLLVAFAIWLWFVPAV